MITINKDTILYGSFSNNPGNNGTIFFNNAFQLYNINAIYKAFYGDDAEKIVSAARTLQFGGFAVSMPLKTTIYKYLDELSIDAWQVGAVNTVVNTNGRLVGYNTDWYGVERYFRNVELISEAQIPLLTILGDGGFSKAVQYTCRYMGIPYKVVTRKDWNLVSELDGYVFNATPVDVVVKGTLIDGRPNSPAGLIIARYQAEKQFKLYTNIDYGKS